MTDDNPNAVRKWGDEQQYDAAPMQANYDEKTGVLPKVHLLWMTPDPLGAIAAACRMYEGKPTYDLSDITDEERRHYWQQAQATHLKAPLEFVQFHFFLEGVDRAFTHQHVRQRTAVFAQESMRFAVVNDLKRGTSLPPSLHGTETTDTLKDGPGGRFWADTTSAEIGQHWRDRWDDAMEHIQSTYRYLVDSGMPAEEARGLLPHATVTRENYDTNLRNLLDHAGNRLCTQAQFHWRLVFAQIAQAIRDYDPNSCRDSRHDGILWQYEELAKVFRPVCYEQGRCPFKASFDRDCSIRDRVDTFAAHGIPSSEWHLDHEIYNTGGDWKTILRADDLENVPDHYGDPEEVPGILPQEWAMDPDAARRH